MSVRKIVTLLILPVPLIVPSPFTVNVFLISTSASTVSCEQVMSIGLPSQTMVTFSFLASRVTVILSPAFSSMIRRDRCARPALNSLLSSSLLTARCRKMLPSSAKRRWLTVVVGQAVLEKHFVLPEQRSAFLVVVEASGD
jgi:hypothetical protein